MNARWSTLHYTSRVRYSTAFYNKMALYVHGIDSKNNLIKKFQRCDAITLAY